MPAPETYTLAEIRSQPEAWAATLATLGAHAHYLRALYHDGGHDAVVFTGCGSPYYAALSAAVALEELAGIPARALPASEIWFAPRQALAFGQKPLLVALSRSGQTTELLRAIEAFRTAGGAALTLTSYPDRPLAALGTYHLTLPAGQEQSTAQTRAFSTLYLATLYLAALWGTRDDLLDELAALPERGRQCLLTYEGATRALGRDESIDRFYLLGSGARYGLAAELSLKLKEMSLTHSEPFHPLEFRHGPKAMVTSNTLVVALLAASRQPREATVVDEMRTLGARTLTIAANDADIAFGEGLHELVGGPLYLLPMQLIAYERAIAKGLDPDNPTNLSAVVTLTE